MRRAVLLLLVAFSSCAHTSRFISVPAGAKISVDGKPVGTAPLLLDERSGTPGRKREIRAEVPGQNPITRTEGVTLCTSAGNILLDLLLIGFVFGFCYPDETLVDFTAAR